MGKVRRTAYDVAIGAAAASGGDSGRAASAAAFVTFEKLVRRINTLRFGTGSIAMLVAVTFAMMLFSDGSQHFVSNDAAGWVIVVAAMVAFAAVAVWPIFWLIGVPKFLRATVFAAGLQPFHKLREAIESGHVIAGRPDGGIHSAPLFESPWALTAFSRNEDVRHMRLPGSRTGVLDEPLIEIDDNEPEADTEEHFVVAASLDRVANRLEIVEKVVAEVSQAKDRPLKPPQLHWYAGVAKETHMERSPDIANRWSGPHFEQVTHALNKAFELTRDCSYPCILAKDLADRIAESLKEGGLSVGLGDSDSESKVWLEKMFGSGSKNDYAFVRRYLTEPDYKLPYELPLGR
jgi:hypothetical protein